MFVYSKYIHIFVNEIKNKKMTFQESITADKIQSILDKVNSIELNLFPATKNRLLEIVLKLQSNKILSESDYETLKLNNL